MSKATKRKHVTREVLDEFVIPSEKQTIVKIVGSRGNNLHEAEDQDGRHFLISMPSKFRRNIWIKRGDFVIVDPIKEGNKVCGEIAHILYPEQVKYLKQESLWPKEFLNEKNDKFQQVETSHNENGEELSSDAEGDDDLFVNPNHLQKVILNSDSSDEDEVSDESSGNEECENAAMKSIIDNNNKI